MIFAKPFPDELASYHLKRIWAINDYKKNGLHSQAETLARATRNQHGAAEQPWTRAHSHEILAHLSAMTAADYRARHTLLALSGHWDTVHSLMPVKETKVPVYSLAAFYSNSEAASSPYRFCQQCSHEDVRRYDMVYLHRLHHLPGVDICPLHHTALQYACPKSLSTATHKVEYVHARLIEAQQHPIIERYRTLVCRALENSHQLQYDHAGEKLLERAHNMGLCRRQLAHSGTYYHLEHELPQFIYANLPKAWLNHHFAPDHIQYSAPIRPIPDQWHYHQHLAQLKFPENCAPAYLLLTLAALFESADDVCAFLFK